MKNITVKNIIEATGGTLLCGDINVELYDVCINSREVKDGDLFIPIIGANVDAHRFIKSALDIGAATLTSKEDIDVETDKPVILVKDTIEALQQIGMYIRNRYDIPVVGVTGSVGKTTTREMISAALKTGYKTFHTEGNFNSQIGVPITLSRMTDEYEVAVLELGMSEQGQIVKLSNMIRPTISVVTTIGLAHVEYLGSQENIRTEKLSIIEGMNKDGILLLNGDDKMLAQMRGKMPCTTYFYGCEDWCDYRAMNISYEKGKSYFIFVHGEDRISVELNALGKHNVANCVAAMAIADMQGIPLETARKAFVEFEGQRLQIVELENKYTIIDDTYNASPTSVKASIDVLCDMNVTGKRYLVLADMLELGENSPKYHYDVGTYISDKHIDELIVIGELSMNIKQAVDEGNSNIRTCSFTDNEEIAMYLMALMQPEDVVLLKGSNGMHLCETVEILKD